jgi:hypothetical protein
MLRGVEEDFGSSESCRESEILGSLDCSRAPGVAGGFGLGGLGYPLIS